MNQREKLKDMLTVQSGIIISCDAMIKDISYLVDKGNGTDKEHEVILGNQFFPRMYNLMWAQLTIELFHLFDKKQDYSLSKLLNISINETKPIDWRKPDLQKLMVFKQRIEDTDIQEISGNLAHIRHKMNAHIDKNRFAKEVLLDLADVMMLHSIAEGILVDVYYQLDGTTVEHWPSSIGSVETVVSKLVKYTKYLEL